MEPRPPVNRVRGIGLTETDAALKLIDNSPTVDEVGNDLRVLHNQHRGETGDGADPIHLGDRGAADGELSLGYELIGSEETEVDHGDGIRNRNGEHKQGY